MPLINTDNKLMTPTNYYLVADIGGTNARFAISNAQNHQIVVHENLNCQDFNNIDAAVCYFLAKHVNDYLIKYACFAVAAPVMNNRVKFTNSHWYFDIDKLQRKLDLEKLLVINDFKAQACSIPFLQDSDSIVLIKPNKKVPNDLPISIIGAGTGLGVASLHYIDGNYLAMTSEGGHAGFTPSNDMENEVLSYLMSRFGYVTREHILSGPGIVNLYQAVASISKVDAPLNEPYLITQAALEKNDPLALTVLTMFCQIMGTVCADIILTQGSNGALYIAGGIAPKIQKIFEQGAFSERFLRKGSAYEFLRYTPVYLITQSLTGLIGASAALQQYNHGLPVNDLVENLI